MCEFLRAVSVLKIMIVQNGGKSAVGAWPKNSHTIEQKPCVNSPIEITMCSNLICLKHQSGGYGLKTVMVTLKTVAVKC